MRARTIAEPPGHLLHNLILFGRMLRSLGLPVQPAVVQDFLRAIRWVGIGQKEDFYYAARSLFVVRKEDLPIFDLAFERFWSNQWSAEPRLPSDRRGPAHHNPSGDLSSGTEVSTLLRELADTAEHRDDDPISTHQTFTYSPAEVLRQKDFGELSVDELQELKRLVAGLTWNLGQRRSRRWRPGNLRLIDFRRTFRESLRSEGEVLRLARRRHKMRPRPLIVLADISGSMERYTGMLLYFVVVLARSLDQPIETFLFSTQLTRISRQLRSRDIERVLREISRKVPDWSGGTRIGQALKTFNYEWARRVLRRRAVVLLISDGWDRGDIGLLRREMARLQRSCYRLIWLNPLLGSAKYEPLTRGIQAALPYVDDFLPVHNLASLEQLAGLLERLDDVRPIRRQQRPEFDRQSI
ncbi:MAG: VWA domain-containing protein [Chloroflexi bacterium]|nr:VWA domain-containing protein [Chloroflexota bacterium]MCH8341290.1 VWA domain-containing protein [Chloroflexota bacterium]MCI0772305.1 VWA domain-containing protein [Chloroflexota bacterium]MCI0806292.1 VWA domain-containing protein [Chloroflexota bacterium]MCI0827188.1 VWA domain-containing protein [Chloroflexota bacterium]